MKENSGSDRPAGGNGARPEQKDRGTRKTDRLGHTALIFVLVLIALLRIGFLPRGMPVKQPGPAPAGYAVIEGFNGPESRLYPLPAQHLSLSELIGARPGSGYEKVMLHSGDRIVMSADGRIDAGRMPDRMRYVAGLKMNLKTATEEDLMLIPGIGKSWAGKIIEARDQSPDRDDMDELLSAARVPANLRQSIRQWAQSGE